jgi:hypothetical protein
LIAPEKLDLLKVSALAFSYEASAERSESSGTGLRAILTPSIKSRKLHDFEMRALLK